MNEESMVIHLFYCYWSELWRNGRKV